MTEERLRNLEQQIGILDERVKNWMVTTDDYRHTLNRQIREVQDTIHSLPCPDRRGKYESLSRQVTLQWLFLTLIVLAVVKSMLGV